MSSSIKFLELVASELGGTLRREGDKLELVLTGRQAIVINQSAEEKEITQDRLEFVEKQAAIVLLTAPVLFAAELKNPQQSRSRKTVLRVAFGYRLIKGRPCFRRYTSYLEPTSGRTVIIRGDDHLLGELSSTILERNADHSLINEYLHEMSRQVAEAQNDYLTDKDVKAELQALAERQRSELFELNLLYNRKSQRHLRTYGVNPEKPSEKPTSPVDEFRRKRLIVYQRHVPRVSVDVLSLSTVRIPLVGKAGPLQLPFWEGIPENSRLNSSQRD